MNPIKVSIIVVSYNAAHTIESCLRSLEPQVCEPDSNAEVIVVDSSSDATAQIVATQFPWVRLLVSAQRKYPGDARNAGIAQARGALLAFVDSDCVTSESWLTEILKAHASHRAAIGGSVDNANPESYVGWGYYFCEFTRWAPNLAAGELVEVPTCCLAVKRWAYDRYGPFQEGAYCSDTHFNWRLGRAGHRPLFEPKIKVSHINIVNLRKFLNHEVEHGRAFGALRVAEEKFSRWRCLVYFMASPVLPAWLLARITGRVLVNRIYPGRFVLALPVTLLGLAAWCWGEVQSYAAGLRLLSSSSVPIAGPIGEAE